MDCTEFLGNRKKHIIQLNNKMWSNYGNPYRVWWSNIVSEWEQRLPFEIIKRMERQ